MVNEIIDLKERKGYEYNEIAVLYRANFQSLYPEEAFLQNKIPYFIQGGSNFYNRREIKILLDYLRVINNPDCDDADDSLLNILNAPVRYISNKSKAELKEFCGKKGIHLYQRLKSTRFDTPFIRKNIREFIQFMDPLILSVDTFAPSELLKLLRNNLDYDRFILDEDMPTIDDIIIENLNQLELSSSRYKDIKSFLEYTDSFKDSSISEDKNGVQLMTIHKSKGLEIRVVFVIGMVENLLPSAKGNIEEERRICFVAISSYTKINTGGAVGGIDSAGNPRNPIFVLSPGVAASITGDSNQGAGNATLFLATIYHTGGTSDPTSSSGKKEYSCIVDEIAGTTMVTGF